MSDLTQTMALSQAAMLSYLALLVFASCTEKIRSVVWEPWWHALKWQSESKQTWLFVNGLRAMAYGLVLVAMAELSDVYGATIGMTNWFCLAAVLASVVVLTLSYARSSLSIQLWFFAVLTGVSFIL